jgi:hypothetical protein
MKDIHKLTDLPFYIMLSMHTLYLAIKDQVTAACVFLLPYSRCSRTAQLSYGFKGRKREPRKKKSVCNFLLLVSHCQYVLMTPL